LYFLETPKYKRMYEDADYLELYDGCLKELEALGMQRMFSGEDSEKQNSGVGVILLSETLGFATSNPNYFQDLIHLSAEGRNVYTELLCETLKEATP